MLIRILEIYSQPFSNLTTKPSLFKSSSKTSVGIKNESISFFFRVFIFAGQYGQGISSPLR